MSGHYVPITREVRRCYATGSSNALLTAADFDEGLDVFDRWLAAHDAEVAASALRGVADTIKCRNNEPLMAALLDMECNDTARLAAEWCEGLLRERADAMGEL